ncbi:hypothetical protein ACHAXS_005361 [Conticribra weissflogii]
MFGAARGKEDSKVEPSILPGTISRFFQRALFACWKSEELTNQLCESPISSCLYDLFQTIFNDTPVKETSTAAIYDKLFEHARDWYGEKDFDGEGTLIFHPPALEDIWLSEEERREKKVEVRLRKDADCAWKDAFEKRFEEEICASPDLDDDAGGRVPNLIPADSDSDSSDDNSDDESIIAGLDAPPVGLAPEGAHLIPPEGDDFAPPPPPRPAPPAAPNINPNDDILPLQQRRSRRLRRGGYNSGGLKVLKQ